MKHLRGSRRVLLGLALVALAVAAVVGAGAAVSGSTKEAKIGAAAQQKVQQSARTKRDVPPLTAAQVVKLRAAALQMAAGGGEKAPSRIRAVATTRMAANQLDSGATVNTDQNVVMVTMHGRFSNGSSPMDSSVQLPAGSVLTFTYDLSQDMILDYSVGRQEPNLAQLGAVQDITGG